MEIENIKTNWLINHKVNAERKREKGGGKERNQNKSLNSERLKRRRLPLSFPAIVYLLNPSYNHLIISFQSQFSTYGSLIPFISECCPFSSRKRKLLAFCILPAFFCVCSVAQSRLTLCDPMDRSPPGSSDHGAFWARILEWVPFPPPGDLPSPRIKPASLASPALADGFITTAPPDH